MVPVIGNVMLLVFGNNMEVMLSVVSGMLTITFGADNL